MHDELRGADALARPDLPPHDPFARFRLDPRWAIALVAIVGAVAVVIVARTRPEVAVPPTTFGAATTLAGAPAGEVALGGTTSTTVVATTPSTIVVHVAGAVRSPGVVHLPAGARADDAIDAAGGAGPRADLALLNLAAVLADGQQVRVPRRGVPSAPTGAGVPSPTGADPGAVGTVSEPPGNESSPEPSPESPLALNAATAEELEALPGIGPALAAAIVAERERLGGFTSVDDLLRVRGIGEQRLADLRPLVVL